MEPLLETSYSDNFSNITYFNLALLPFSFSFQESSQASLLFQGQREVSSWEVTLSSEWMFASRARQLPNTALYFNLSGPGQC